MLSEVLRVGCQSCWRVTRADTFPEEGWEYVRAPGLPLLCPKCLPEADLLRVGDRDSGYVNDFEELRIPDRIEDEPNVSRNRW